jgi:pantoate--beta-alanine ligase
MDVFRAIEPLQGFLAERRQGRPVVLVPTMGALHAGHGACVAVGREVPGALVVCSIFVNPTQFGPGEDFDAYPRTLAADVEHLRAWRCDALFSPSREVMYPEPPRAWVTVDGVSEPLCGRFRPGHFRAVATVVTKLFHIVTPDLAVFGQKDAQQALVVRSLVRQLNMGVGLRLCRTVREPDGLALSSRNGYLTPDERTRAAGLYRALGRARAALEAGERDPAAVERAAMTSLRADGFDRIDYAEVRRADDLCALERVEGRVILAAAAWVGRTRLIDNMVFDVEATGVVADVALF